MMKSIDFRALVAILLFLLFLLFSLPNLLVAMVLVLFISGLMELILALAKYQPKRVVNPKSSPQSIRASLTRL